MNIIFVVMQTCDQILNVLRKHKEPFMCNYSVKQLGLFGSYAKGNPRPESDVDILVDMPADYRHFCAVWNILENELQLKVDLVRKGPHLREHFLHEINTDILYM